MHFQSSSEANVAAVISALYRQFLDSWNERDAAAMAALFAEDGLLVGFDGSLKILEEVSDNGSKTDS